MPSQRTRATCALFLSKARLTGVLGGLSQCEGFAWAKSSASAQPPAARSSPAVTVERNQSQTHLFPLETHIFLFLTPLPSSHRPCLRSASTHSPHRVTALRCSWGSSPRFPEALPCPRWSTLLPRTPPSTGPLHTINSQSPLASELTLRAGFRYFYLASCWGRVEVSTRITRH